MSHTVEILSVGTELLLGNIVNLDAQILSQGLSALGLNVYWHTVVGDNPQRAREAVAAAKGRAGIIITTGSGSAKQWTLPASGRTFSSPPGGWAPPVMT